MIPEFNEDGNLPPGTYPATLDEIEARFGRQSELRRVQMESLRWLVDLVRRAGVEQMILNGSFVTDVLEPNDVDCAILIGETYPADWAAAAELAAGLPFLDIELVTRRGFDTIVNRVYATDRHQNPKGMVEVVL